MIVYTIVEWVTSLAVTNKIDVISWLSIWQTSTFQSGYINLTRISLLAILLFSLQSTREWW